MLKIKPKQFYILSILSGFFWSFSVQAYSLFSDDLSKKIRNKSGQYAQGSGLQEVDLTLVVATLIQAFIGLLAIIFLALIVYGGYRWMMARGDENNIEEARGIIRHAIIGLIITLCSYAIAYFVILWLSWIPAAGNVSGPG